MFRRKDFKTRHRPPKQRQKARLEVELLEDRLAPAIITVTGKGDDVAVGDGEVTLREAIVSANNNADVNADVTAQNPGVYGNDEIRFNIQAAGVQTIDLTQPLQIETDPLGLTILGYTQPGALPNNQAVGNNAVLMIRLSGAVNQVIAGIWIRTGNTTIQGLEIVDFTNDGIRIEGEPGRTNNKIQGNYIHSNDQDGIYLHAGATGNLIGGTSPAHRNTISDNSWNGIFLSSSEWNTIQNNYIGTTPAGGGGEGNTQNGIRLLDSNDNLIGGTSDAARNLISGNIQNGVLVEGTGSRDNLIQRNYIGTNRDGTGAIANWEQGVLISNASGTIIGGGDPADPAKVYRNVISGNLSNGVRITGAQATGNKVTANYIGTNAAGTAAVRNLFGGVEIDGSHGNVIGEGSGGWGNLISGNGEDGMEFADGIYLLNSNNTLIEGNIIGLDRDRANRIPNHGNGIRITGGQNNVIGGAVAAQENWISGNKEWGIRNGGNQTKIQNNKIGVRGDGTTPEPNLQGNILVAGINSLIELNVVWHSNGPGIAVVGGTGHRITGNSIKSNTALGIDLGNDGVTPDDLLDADAGPNRLQNAPGLSLQPGDPTIYGHLHSTPYTSFTIDVYLSDEPDPSGYGEGETYAFSVPVTTDEFGDGYWVMTSLAVGKWMTATATHDALGDTSEFSNALQVPSMGGMGGGGTTVGLSAQAASGGGGDGNSSGDSSTQHGTAGDAAGGRFIDPAPWVASAFLLAVNPGDLNGTDRVAVLPHDPGHIRSLGPDEGGVPAATLVPEAGQDAESMTAPAATPGSPPAGALDLVFAGFAEDLLDPLAHR